MNYTYSSNFFVNSTRPYIKACAIKQLNIHCKKSEPLKGVLDTSNSASQKEENCNRRKHKKYEVKRKKSKKKEYINKEKDMEKIGEVERETENEK